MSDYITSDEVYKLTGITVDADELDQAQAIIETMTKRDLSDLYRFSDADVFWVRRAIAYQAAWMTAQVDTFERIDVTSLTYDELTVTPRDEESFIVAPLARTALSNCSWANSRGSRQTATSLDATPTRYGILDYDVYRKQEVIRGGVRW